MQDWLDRESVPLGASSCWRRLSDSWLLLQPNSALLSRMALVIMFRKQLNLTNVLSILCIYYMFKLIMVIIINITNIGPATHVGTSFDLQEPCAKYPLRGCKSNDCQAQKIIEEKRRLAVLNLQLMQKSTRACTQVLFLLALGFGLRTELAINGSARSVYACHLSNLCDIPPHV